MIRRRKKDDWFFKHTDLIREAGNLLALCGLGAAERPLVEVSNCARSPGVGL